MTQQFIGTIDPAAEDGTELAARLTAFDTAYKTNQSGSTRPTGIAPGGIWTREVSSGVFQLMLYDGATDRVVGATALTTQADRLPYYSAEQTLALATLTAFGRSLIDDANAAAGRATLGLTYATNAEAQTGTATDKVISPAALAAAMASGGGAGFGVGYDTFSVSRTHGTTYQNTTGKPIFVTVYVLRNSSTAVFLQTSANGSTWRTVGGFPVDTYGSAAAMVSAGHYYRTTGGGVSVYNVTEYR